MDKNAIKKYAIWARRELIARVSQRAAMYEITAEGYGDADAVSVHGRILSQEEKNQRRALITKIKEKGYEQVMEEVAYTWFNRFSALRFMEVNGYLPSHVRVFTDDENKFKPQIMTEAINLEMDGLDMQKIYAFKTANDDDGLFKYLIISQCNALFSILPGMFQQISDYTELLFPDNLLREGSVVEQMIFMIQEEDWTDQVQIIGWLYQYYNTEPKDQVFANLKKNIKISKENIPAATQLFTPDWIVRYMVENSLGRLWIEGHPNEELKDSWNYYLEEAEQEDGVQRKLAEIRKEYAALKPEDLRCIDPCMGSGHILVYMFDLLVQIYTVYGYSPCDAVSSIIKNNLWGLDIDIRAVQLAYFSIMMKARQYDRHFFARKNQPHVYVIEDSNGIDSASIQNLGLKLTQEEYNIAYKQAIQLVEEMHDAKEYGSIIRITPFDAGLLRRFAISRTEEKQISLDVSGETETSTHLLNLINVGEILSQKYYIVVTNPPYMGSGNMNPMLQSFMKKNYPRSKSDLSTVFMEHSLEMCEELGFMAMINIPVWMFLPSYQQLREIILRQNTYINLVHPGRGIFGSDFGTTTFVIGKSHISGYKGKYRRLFDKQGEVESSEVRRVQYLSGKGEFIPVQENFEAIPGMPVAYWASTKAIEAFRKGTLMSALGQTTKGIITGDNERYMRLWWEVHFTKINFSARNDDDAYESKMKWFPCTKGGNYRKWYGNKEYIMNWENRGYRILNDAKAEKRHSQDYYPRLKFQKGISWSVLTASARSFRIEDKNLIEHVGMAIFMHNNDNILPSLAFLNSKVCSSYLTYLSPTVAVNAGEIGRLPFIFSDKYFKNLSPIVEECIRLCKNDWDAFETSWEFDTHPLICKEQKSNQNIKLNIIAQIYENWRNVTESNFQKLRDKEKEINRLFIDIYGLNGELTSDVDDKDITVRKADYQRDIRSLISYAIGCMFGRYSLDQPGLILAGQDFKEKFVYSNVPLSGTSFSGMPSLVSGKRVCYLKRGDNDFVRCTFEPDEDAIIPICDDEYFNDDIVSRFVEFVEVVYGKETLEENLQFIADALGGSGTSREIIRNYFNNGFYADHLKVYQKRPIYWLFDSGKKNGFKCLVYMHRYKPDTIARIRTDYVHEQQSRYRTAIADLQTRIDNAANTSERVKLSKKLKTVQEQDEELRIYEEKIHHLADQMIKIDLDDGVKVNYAKFQDVLAKIK